MAPAAARSCPTICAPTSAALAHDELAGEGVVVGGADVVELAATATGVLLPPLVVYRSR